MPLEAIHFMFSLGSSPTFLFLNTDYYIGATFIERKLFRDFHGGNSCSNIDLYSGMKLVILCNRFLSITWLINCLCLVKLYCFVLSQTWYVLSPPVRSFHMFDPVD